MACHVLTFTFTYFLFVIPYSTLLSVFVLFLCLSRAQGWASECPDVKNYKWLLNPVWHRMLYSCTHMATVGVKLLRCVWVVCCWCYSCGSYQLY